MGRFYRTASANPMDYMYKLNTPLMERVISTNDNYIDQNLAQADQLGQAANFNHLEQDTEDAKAITDQYTNKINTIADAIRKDPANWRKQLDPIRTVKQDLVNNYQTGAISKLVGNYNKRKLAFDEADKQVELYHTSGGKKGVSPERAVAYKNDWDTKFGKTQYDAKTGTYNAYKGGSIMDNIDVKKVLADGLDKIKADKSNQYEEKPDGSQWYFNKITQKTERITPEKVLQLATDNINPELMNYLREDSRVGLVKGVYDQEGNFIKPYDFTKVNLSPEESSYVDKLRNTIAKTKDPKTRKAMEDSLNGQLSALNNRTQLQWNNESYFAPILRGLTNQFSYSNTESGNTMKNNSVGSTRFNAGQTWARQTRQLKQQDDHFKTTQNGINDRFNQTIGVQKDKLEFDKYKWDNPHTTGSNSSTGTKSKNAGTPTPVETTTSKLSTNSFESIMTHDPKSGKDVPVLSVAGLGADIDNFKNQQSHITTELKHLDEALDHKPNPSNPIEVQNYALLEKRKVDLSKQLENVNSNLNDRRTWYKKTTDAVLNNDPTSGVKVEKTEADLYNKYQGKPVSELQGNIEKLKKQFPDQQLKNADGTPMVVRDRYQVGESPQVQAARKELAQYADVRKKILEGKENVLKSVRTNPVNSDAILLNDKEGTDVGDMIANNTRGLKIFDMQGNPAENSFKPVDGKGVALWNENEDNYKFSFQGQNNLKDYIDRYGVKVKVQRVGSTTRIGNDGNAVAQVVFDDPTGNLPKTPFYVGLSSDLQRDVSNKFSKHSNPAVAKIAKSIGNEEANNIRTQLVNPLFNKVSGEDTPKRTLKVTDNQGNQVPLHVTELEDGHIFVQGEDEKGNLKVFPRIKGTGRDGFFNGVEDFIEQLQAQKYGKNG